MRRARHVGAVLAVSGLMLAGCSHGSSGAPTTTPASAPSPTTATPSPSTPPAPAVNPFTGLAVSRNPVVAVKIDDTSNGRPQQNIDKADIVYVEQAEGGLTRLMAIFNTTLPVVEPVRSVRPADPELAQQFGHIIFVASGGSPAGIAPLNRSPLKKVINDNGADGFDRDPHRPAPYNLQANLAHIAKRVKGPKAKSIGLTWSARPTGPSQPARSVHTRVGGTTVTFDWNRRLGRYERVIDGQVQRAADGKIIATPNVIVQFCKITTYTRDRDVLGNPAQYTHTLGHGRVAVFRNGRRINGTWSRNKVTAPTVLRGTNGKVIPLARGGEWFVLVATKAPLTS